MSNDGNLPPEQRLAIWLNAALWTAGHSLTSGAFLTYFAHDLQASATVMALILAAPELTGLMGLFSERVWNWFGRRRLAWLTSTILARVVTLLIPFAGSGWLLELGWGGPELLLGLIVISQMFQSIATALYFSWLSDLTPATGWGRLFAGRNIAVLLVQMTVPLSGSLLRDEWRRASPAEDLWLAYAVVFCIGTILLVLSVLPMLSLPDPFERHSRPSSAWLSSMKQIFRHRGPRWLLAHSWCLAAANGLTQAAFFKFQIGVIGLSLTGYLLLFNGMLALQLVGSTIAGRCRTARDHRLALLIGTAISSVSLLFWLLASREQWWWLVGAFACWGAFGLVNVAGPNLMLTFTQPGDTTLSLALFRQIAGVLAGLSGILGGVVLDAMLQSTTSDAGPILWPFWTLFLASWLGRMCAAALVLTVPIDEDDRKIPSRLAVVN